MKKTIYPNDSFKHIACSIIAFNGFSPIMHFPTDNQFLTAWRARQIKKQKVDTIKTFDRYFAEDPEWFYAITGKLRYNITKNPGEMKAFGYFRRKYGLSREEVEDKLGLNK